jgi:hypothetical protein
MRPSLAPLLLVTALAWLLAPRAISAQDPTLDPGTRDRLTTLFSDLSPEEDVQIVTPSLFIEEGAYRGLGTDVVRVGVPGGSQTVPVDFRDIRSVSVRRGHAVKGALWGLGSGALVGGFTGFVVGGYSCNTPQGCNDLERRGAVRYGIVFGIVGAAAGYVLGRMDRDWVPVFP